MVAWSDLRNYSEEIPLGEVQNRIGDDKAYAQTYPRMRGKNEAAATQELHTFLAPLNPSEQDLERYYGAVQDWNDEHPELTDKMKACYLALVFRGEEGKEQTVKVMQSSRYFRCDDQEEVVRQMHADADYFASQGFDVLREKIEATAYGIEGIPQTHTDVEKFPSKYFEFHIKVSRQDREDTRSLTPEEVDQLKKVSRLFSQKFDVPVPLSYNCNRDQVTGDGKGHQKFLNLRFRGKGIKEIAPLLKEVTAAIEQEGFRLLKTISEYVWYDSYQKMDVGWIDFE